MWWVIACCSWSAICCLSLCGTKYNYYIYLNINTSWGNLANDKLMKFCLFPQKTGFDISCKLSPQFAWNIKACFLGKIKLFQNVICWNYLSACTALNTSVTKYNYHTTLQPNSSDNKLIFFLFFSENRLWYFMQIVSTICMKCQSLFSGKNKIIPKYHMLKLIISMHSIKYEFGQRCLRRSGRSISYGFKMVMIWIGSAI